MTAPLTQPHELRGRRVLVIGTFDPDHAPRPAVVPAPRPARLRRRGDERRLVGIRPRVRHRGLAGADVAQRAARTVARPSGTSSRASDPISSCSCIPGISTRACSARSRASAGSPRCSTCSSRSTTPSWSTAGCAARAPRSRSRRAPSTRWPVGACARSWSTRRSTPTSSRASRTATGRTSRCCGSVPRKRGSSPADDPGDDAPILWYLTYIPLHGFETVARAAALLADDGAHVPAGRRRPATSRGRAARAGARPHEHRVRRAGPGVGAARRDRAGVDLPRRVRHQRQGRPRRAQQGVPVRGRPAGRSSPRRRRRCIDAFGDALVTVPVGDPAALADAAARAARARSASPSPRAAEPMFEAQLLRSRARRRPRPNPRALHRTGVSQAVARPAVTPVRAG